MALVKEIYSFSTLLLLSPTLWNLLSGKIYVRIMMHIKNILFVLAESVAKER
jgi:hypothetical protein